jgi:hypothetical protein
MSAATTPTAGIGHNSDLAQKIKDEYSRILDGGKDIVARAIKFGEMLNDSKGTIGHGDWLIWLKTNCNMSERTSQRYMDMAKPDNKRKIENWLRGLRPGQASLNKAIAQIKVSKRKTIATASEQYDACEKKLIEKLQNLSPNSVEAAAAETVSKLKEAVAGMQKPKAA